LKRNKRFDKILLDAPCSREGLVRKKRDALINWSPTMVNKKAYEQISGKKEMVVMSSWTLFQIGRLKYEQGDKEGSIVDLKKVLELDSDQMGFALKQPKLMSTYLLLKINKG
jgi:hypothetical protein